MSILEYVYNIDYLPETNKCSLIFQSGDSIIFVRKKLTLSSIFDIMYAMFGDSPPFKERNDKVW